MAGKIKHFTLSCIECGAKCCRHLALEIDTPTNKQDYDNIRWYLYHKKVTVFIDHDDEWYLEFDSKCEALGKNNKCQDYKNRPRICRDYGILHDEPECVFHAEGEAHKHHFSKVEDFEKYLDDKGINWRWKNKNLKPKR